MVNIDRHQVPKVLNLSNGRPPPLFIEGSPKLAVTLKFRENRVFTDSPPHRARTVRHFKSNGYILNKCFSELTVTARADGPPDKWRTVRSSFGHPIQKDQVSAPVSVFMGGPSAPMDQMVRNSFWTTIQSQNQICSSSNETTVDRPPPRSGPYAGLFPAEMYLGNTAITLRSNVQIW